MCHIKWHKGWWWVHIRTLIHQSQLVIWTSCDICYVTLFVVSTRITLFSFLSFFSFFCLSLRLHIHGPQNWHSRQSTKWFCFLVFCLVVNFEWNCLWLLGQGNRRSFSTKLWAGIPCSWLVIGLRPHMKRVVTVTCCLSFLYLVFLFLFLFLFVLAK